MPVNFAVAILKGSTSGDYISGRVTAVVSSPTRIQSLTVKAKGAVDHGPGRHVYPFTFQLPNKCVSYCINIKVQYKIKSASISERIN
ncbi:uncharacterized protein LOC116220255 isoform X8 [Clupea harengus]|uniref:Uncharacterized protein LOC116220255 isoform X8 n=1 Tax=Clupea harengus TaxID=7950 RepID=A0A6P8FE68_CLUHA|nr:uncharacterized protein LOC116220255 isoform X8 [Clupea harengus]